MTEIELKCQKHNIDLILIPMEKRNSSVYICIQCEQERRGS